ncbi:MAG: prolyl aminopeptidase [Bauldia sp.]
MNVLAQPFATHRIDVGDGHVLHVEEVGVPTGVPAIFLHGGPGSGCRPDQRVLFDPGRHRAILFDQRGAGRSAAEDRFRANTTDHLVADMERIRETLGIDRWLVIGGSWGATLGLAYAERHRERVLGLVLRAVFLGTRAELDWAFVDGPRRLRPELYGDFVGHLSEEERDDPLPAYWRRILDPDPAVHLPAAWAWHDTERILSEVSPSRTRLGAPAPGGAAPSTPFLEAHYFAHDCFFAPDELLLGAERLGDIPGIIIQGRYDFLCPPANSAALAARWHNASLRIIEGAGHAMSEPGVTPAMRQAIAELTAQVRG